MATGDFSADHAQLNASLQNIEKVLNPDAMATEVIELEKEASAPNLWDDQVKAQAVTSRLSSLQAELSRLRNLRSRVDDVQVLHELGQLENDDSILAEGKLRTRGNRKSIK